MSRSPSGVTQVVLFDWQLLRLRPWGNNANLSSLPSPIKGRAHPCQQSSVLDVFSSVISLNYCLTFCEKNFKFVIKFLYMQITFYLSKDEFQTCGQVRLYCLIFLNVRLLFGLDIKKTR